MLKLPNEANLDSYRALCSDDAEQDFFNNIVHLQVTPLLSSLKNYVFNLEQYLCGLCFMSFSSMQKHRRARALSRFSNIVSSGNLSKVSLSNMF